MRVIAGEFKGRKLVCPKGTVLRPTSDRVKEAIFSMLLPDTDEAVCLDLFAGTGALGIEALSRGATRVYFCDNSAAAHAALMENLDACRAGEDRAVVFKADWRAAAMNIREKCNLVFIDAPYEMCVYYSQILETLEADGLLEAGASIIIERDTKAGNYALPPGFEIERERRYGSVGVDLIYFGEVVK